MLVNTKELKDAALDWATAKSEGLKFNHIEHSKTGTTYLWLDPEFRDNQFILWSPSTDWSQGGPIIEREVIVTSHDRNYDFDQPWRCALSIDPYSLYEGPTNLIAAMRCYVASKLGDEVDVPESLT